MTLISFFKRIINSEEQMLEIYLSAKQTRLPHEHFLKPSYFPCSPYHDNNSFRIIVHMTVYDNDCLTHTDHIP